MKNKPTAWSATVPGEGQGEAEVLDARAQAWRSRPLLRQVYHRYFAEMVKHLAVRQNAPAADRYGLVVELGGGSGNFREFFPPVIATDIVPTPHVHLAVDATRLPFADGTVDNLVMQDVLHHVRYPLQFFREAQRVLRPGGRIVMTEPYISPVSRVVFGLGHPEPVVMNAQLFAPPGDPDPSAFGPAAASGAFDANQAIPTLLFFRDLPLFRQRFPALEVKLRATRSIFVYPLSGGFSGRRLIPNLLLPAAWTLEKALSPLGRWLGFRLVVVVEKTGK